MQPLIPFGIICLLFGVEALFPHSDCFNVYGEENSTAIIRNNASRKAAFYEGWQYPEASRLTLASGAMIPISKNMRSDDDIYPIPDECFGDNDELGRHGKHYDLIPCAPGRQPEDMVRICMTICNKIPGCIGVEYDEYFSGLHHCHTHGARDFPMLQQPVLGVQWPKCAYAPSRFLCSDRKEDEWLGVWCPPEDTRPNTKYAVRDKGAPAPAVDPSTWMIGGSLVTNVPGLAVDCRCNETLKQEWLLEGNNVFCATNGASRASQSALGDILEAWLGVQKARIECSVGELQLEAPLTKFVYWLEIQPELDENDIQARIDGTNCDDGLADLPDCTNDDVTWISEQMEARMNVPVPIVTFGLSSWTIEGYRNAVWQDIPDCLRDGERVGFGISPTHYSMQINNVNFLPEEHGGTVAFLKSMSDPLDWFPIPDGCFFDTTVDGTPSNPALKRFGRHFEMLDSFPHVCLGDRSEQQMMRICLTICSHIDYGESDALDGQTDKEIDMACIGVNYDEHGAKGHCHLYSQFDFRIYGYQSSTCNSVRGNNHNEICVENNVYTPREFCPTVGMPSLGSESCGINNTLGIFCHFNTLTCSNTGFHAMGIGFRGGDVDSEWTDIIPVRVPVLDEEIMSPLFGMPGGAGNAGSCKQCDATTYSVRIKKDYENRSLIPNPSDYPDTVNVCKPCIEGRECAQGIGCNYGHDPYTCPPRCRPGHYCPPLTEAGLQCPVNHFQELDGQGSCNVCPTGFTFNLGSDSLSYCLCENGFRRKSIDSVTDATISDPCVACLDGMVCEWDGPTYIPRDVKGQVLEYAALINQGTNYQTIPFLMPGYWASIDNPTMVYRCDVTQESQDCLGGALVPQNTTAGAVLPVTQCRGVTTGKVCNLCPDGYMKDPNKGGCVECGPAAVLPFVFTLVAGAVFFLVFYIVASKMIDNQNKKKREGPRGLDMGVAMVLMGRVVQTVQLLSIFSVLSIPWPGGVKQALESTSFIKLDLDGLQIGCVVNQSALWGYFVKSLIIVLIVLFLPICCVISKAVAPQGFKMSGAVTLHVCGTIMTVLFLSFTTVGFSPFVCLSHPSTEAGTTMAMYSHIQCWEDDHLGMLIVGLMVLLSQIASVCFIAYACFMLPRYSVNAKHRADAMVSVKFVYNNYRADVWFYSFLMLVRNLITAFVPAIAPNEPSIQLAIMTQSLICSFALHCYLWPWHMPLCNAMDFISLSCCLSLVVLAAAWLPRSNNDAFFTTVTEIMMTVAIFGGIITAAISFLLMTPLSKKNPMLAKLGIRWHYVGEIPEVEEAAELLASSASRIATKTKKEMCNTIYDLDAYDKRRLIFMAKFLDSEFHVQTADNSNAPLPIKRIKSTNSLGALEAGESEEKEPNREGGEGGRVVTV